MRSIVVGSALVLAMACAGGPTVTIGPTPLASLPTAQELCALLGTSDWSQQGFTNAAQPHTSSDGSGSAYCTFAGESGAVDGLELDAFVDTTVADAEATFDTIAAGAAGGQQITLPGADEVLIQPAIDNTFGAIVVRAGRFTFTVSLPSSPQAEAQLLALAGIVLSRASWS